MPVDNEFMKLSNTRGASLRNLTALCVILADSPTALSVKKLANRAIGDAVFEFPVVEAGDRLPTRIHHHMIALRKLELVGHRQTKGSRYYSLTATGKEVAETGRGSWTRPIRENPELQSIWRKVLVRSRYVRHHWLKYFMPVENFTLEELLANAGSLDIYRVSVDMRANRHEDSGYRLSSARYGIRVINSLEYREILQGLKRWTTDVYLTDDWLPEGFDLPHFYQRDTEISSKVESVIVRKWLTPGSDNDYFAKLVDDRFISLQVNRIPMPELIMALCRQNYLSKFNVREMLTELYYHKNKEFFFERGSEFLVRGALDISHPEDYYVNIEGVWRTGLVRLPGRKGVHHG